MGRWLNADGIINSISFLGYNLYTYCLNNPVNLIDTNGREPILFTLSAIAIVLLKAITLATMVYCVSKMAVKAISDFNIEAPNVNNSVGAAKTEKSISTPSTVEPSIITKSAKTNYVSTIDLGLSYLWLFAPSGYDGSIGAGLGRIAEKHGLLHCDAAAKEMLRYLKRNKEPGYIVKINFSSESFILSESKNVCVSYNGMHMGTYYKGLVHCVVHPMGLPANIWVNDFIGVGEKTVTTIMF